MTFNKIIIKNTLRNFKSYTIYLIGGVFSVAIFFIYSSILYHPSLNSVKYKDFLTYINNFKEIIYFFSIIFTISFSTILINWREKEFKTLKNLGFYRDSLTKIIFIESCTRAFFCITLGLISGLVFLKFFLVILSGIISLPKLKFYISISSIIKTLIRYSLTLILLPSMCYMVLDKKLNIKNSFKNKENSFLCLFILTITCLGLFILEIFLIKIIIKNGANQLLFFILTLICFFLKNYLFFMYVLQFIIKVLTKIKKIYFKKKNFILLSNLKYKVKKNGLLLIFITFFLSLSFILLTVNYTNYRIAKEEIDIDSPFTINFINYDMEFKNNERFIDTILNKNNITYSKSKIKIFKVNNYNIISQEDYNKAAPLIGFNTISLKDYETFIVPQFHKMYPDELNILGKYIYLNNNIKLKVTGNIESNVFFQGIYDHTLVVNENLLEKLNIKTSEEFIGYSIKNWTNLLNVDKEISKAYKTIKADQSDNIFLLSKIKYYNQNKETLNLNSYGSYFLSILLYISALSFIHFKFYLDLQNKKHSYKNMLSLGISTSEIKSMLTSEMLIIFFLPFVISVLNTIIVFIFFKSIANTPVTKEYIISLIILFIANILFFLLWRLRNIDIIFFDE